MCHIPILLPLCIGINDLFREMFVLENKIVEKFQMKGKLSVHIELIMASLLTIELQLFNLYYSSKYINSPNFYMI